MARSVSRYWGHGAGVPMRNGNQNTVLYCRCSYRLSNALPGPNLIIPNLNSTAGARLNTSPYPGGAPVVQ